MIKINQKLNSCYYPSNISFKAKHFQNKVNNNADCKDVFVKSASKMPEQKSCFEKFYDIVCFNKAINFTSKPKTKSNITPECFFIRMKGYKKNNDWAEKMVETSYETSEMIKNKKDFFDILDYLCKRVSEINDNHRFGESRSGRRIGSYGAILQENDSAWKGSIEYFDRYDKILSGMGAKKHPKYTAKSIKDYNKANVCRITYEDDYYGVDRSKIVIHYGWINDKDKVATKSNLELCQKAYNKLISKDNPTQKEILDTCAIIQWLIAQECPYMRGNDSIANLLTKSIMHCYNLRISPIKEETSLDFEAFCSNLDDYMKNYPTFFEKYPEKLDKKHN